MPSPAIGQELQTALQLLQAGQYQPAHDLLIRLVASEPRLAQARWMLAGLYYQAGDFTHAEAELITLLALEPGHVPAATYLAHIRLAQGRAGDALAVTRKFSNGGQTSPDMLLLHGKALLATGHAGDAVNAFRRMLQLSPNNGEGEVGLAAALTESGEPAQAEKLLRNAIARGRALPETDFVLARALIAQDRRDAAIAELRAAVHARPDYYTAQLNLCELLWMQTGDVQLATAELDAALARDPSLTSLRQAKATVLQATGALDAAMAELETGIATTGPNFDLDLTLAQIAIGCDPPRAMRHARQALDRIPDDPKAAATLCSALLGNGRADEAAALATKLHQNNPDNCLYLALQASAWRMLGDPRYRDLYDYRCVMPQLIDTPPGWDSLDAYLAELAPALRRMHGSRMHPIGQSLRLGTQVDLDFAKLSDPALKAFPLAIDGPIRRYMAAIEHGDAGWQQRNTGRYRLNGTWSVRLQPHGHHVNHIHPDGWLSSACYIELPPLADNEEHAAWIQFGQPGFITDPTQAAEHFVKPEPGLLALFPSYMWHGTVPFDGGPESSRLTIAFDVVPD